MLVVWRLDHEGLSEGENRHREGQVRGWRKDRTRRNVKIIKENMLILVIKAAVAKTVN